MAHLVHTTPQWVEDSLKWHGEVLHGKFAHWCYDWDELPIDETCFEFTCCSCEFADETGRAEALVELEKLEAEACRS